MLPPVSAASATFLARFACDDGLLGLPAVAGAGAAGAGATGRAPAGTAGARGAGASSFGGAGAGACTDAGQAPPEGILGASMGVGAAGRRLGGHGAKERVHRAIGRQSDPPRALRPTDR